MATSFRLNIINWLSIFSLYIPYCLGAAAVASLACLLPPARALRDPGAALAGAGALLTHLSSVWYAYAVLAASVYWLFSVKPSVYIVDFAVYRPPAAWRVSQADIAEILRRSGHYTAEALASMTRMLQSGGTGDATHWPGTTVRIIRPELRGPGGMPAEAAAEAAAAEARAAEPAVADAPPAEQLAADTSIEAARLNAERVMFDVVGSVLARTGVRARDVDFVIVNCSLFCPTPSLASSICKRFGMRPDVRSYNLGGQGCSAGLISLDLAKQLLENRPASKALVVSFEDITQQLYTGDRKSMLLQNTLFRVGGAAVLLSNAPMDGFRARYKVLHTVRMQDVSDAAHRCVYQCQDEAGKAGVELSRDIMNIAAKTLRDNLTVLGPHVLPIREQVRVVWSYAARAAVAAVNAAAERWGVKRLPGATAASGLLEKPAVYVPDFKLGIQHFCIHAGGRAVIDGIEANLRLAPYHTAPSRATLRDFGNTSSSSIWYELKYAEGACLVRPGAARARRRCAAVPFTRARAPPMPTHPPTPHPPDPQEKRRASSSPLRSCAATLSSAASASCSWPLAAASRPTRRCCCAYAERRAAAALLLLLLLLRAPLVARSPPLSSPAATTR